MDSTHPSRLLLPIRTSDHAHGSEDAPYALVEYGDYECPDCGRLYVTLRDLQRDLASRLRVVFGTIHFPAYITMPSRQQKLQRPPAPKESSGKCIGYFSSDERRFIRKI
jgi:hypothetical protein